MEAERMADRKSRLVRVRADGVVDWRAAGDVWLFAPGESPVHLKGAYTVVFNDAAEEGGLREALVALQPIARPAWQAVIFMVCAGFALGSGLTRLYLAWPH